MDTLRISLASLSAVLILAGCNPGVERLDYSVETLKKSLKDKDPEMRYWAAESLGHFGPQAAVAIPDLIEALKDSNKLVRMGAAYALGEIGPAAAEARSALEQAVKDPEKEVREGATYALQRISGKSVPRRGPK